MPVFPSGRHAAAGVRRDPGGAVRVEAAARIDYRATIDVGAEVASPSFTLDRPLTTLIWRVLPAPCRYTGQGHQSRGLKSSIA